MNVKVGTWKISTFYQRRDKINEQPDYQRGEVWNDSKKALLIDSIIRGVDIPKVYLRRKTNNQFDYEVADGQQRFHAILKFKNNQLALLDHKDKGLSLSTFDGHIIGGKKFHELPEEIQKKFDDYELTIAIIENSTGEEIRTLFGRLQEGTSLTPAEKRNAFLSRLHSPIDNFCLNHRFFTESRIPPRRYKHQDYLAHALALYKYNNSRDLKADLLEEMYLDESMGLDGSEMKDVSEVLDKMHQIDQESTHRIHKKYNFVDVFWFLYQNRARLNKLNPKVFSEIYDKYESLRLASHADPGRLLEKKNVTSFDKSLYSYCMAFRYEGARVSSIEKRNDFYRGNYQKLLFK